MKPVSMIVLLFIITANVLFAQDDYEKWIKKEQESFQKFKDENDQQFLKFLEKNWQPAAIKEGISASKPGPKTIPVPDNTKPAATVIIKAEPKKDIPVKEVPPLKEPVNELPPVNPEKKPADDITKPDAKPASTPPANLLEKNILFFNTPVTVQYDKKLEFNLSGELSSEKIALFWKTVCESEYPVLLSRLNITRDSLRINDWGFAKLCFAAGLSLFSNPNTAYLFTWFILTKDGYRIKVGFDKNRVFLLVPAQQALYGTLYIAQKGEKYYCLNLDNEPQLAASALSTYNDDYPGSDKTFSFAVTRLPVLNKKIEQGKLPYSQNGKDSAVTVEYDASLVKYFENYPYTALPVYFGAAASPRVAVSMLDRLKELLAGKSDVESLCFLLDFVQHTKEYKTDDEQFGRQKPLFYEEFLFYRYADCKDRSIFFSYLVRNLLHLDVIGLDYPDHIATAVNLSSTKIQGTYITYNNKQYLLCDPTFIGASIGMCMPNYQNVQPGIITF